MFENPRRGRQARNFTTYVPKIDIFLKIIEVGCPWLVTVKQHQYPCSRPSIDTTNYRKCVSWSTQLDWKINNGFLKGPVITGTLSGGNLEQGLLGCFNLHTDLL